MAEQGQSAFQDGSRSAPDELIVATEHADFVRALIGSRIRATSDNRRLGLTRVHLTDRRVAEHLRGLLEETAGGGDAWTSLTGRPFPDPGAEDRDRADPIAAVVTGLRALAKAQHGGWMPTVGRNRQVAFPGSEALGATSKTSYGLGATSKTSYGTNATSKTSYGGSDAPRALSAARKWTPPPSRAAGPGEGVRIGVVDTRIWPHPWLAGGWVARPSDVLADGGAAGLIAGHGTFVSGLILSQAPGARLVIHSALDDDGQGNAWDAAEAIVELGSSGVSVINLSFSCYTDDGQPPLVLARAIDRVDADVVVVAAAGNHAALGAGEDPQTSELARFASLPSWPAALDDVVAVGALDRWGRMADFSPVRPWVDAAVRGVDLRSTYPFHVAVGAYPVPFVDGWAEWSGTSFSAALLSGAIAAGIDPGWRSARDVVEDLLAPTPSGPGVMSRPSGPRRPTVRTTGWARGSKAPPR